MEKMEGTEKYANNPNYLLYGYPVNMDSNINIFTAEKWWRYSDTLKIVCYTLYLNLPKFSKRIPKPQKFSFGPIDKVEINFHDFKILLF